MLLPFHKIVPVLIIALVANTRPCEVCLLYIGCFCHDGLDVNSIKSESDSDPLFCLHFSVSPAAERLRHILGEDDSTPTPTIFTEMDTLQHEGDELEWKESARYTHKHTGIRAFISLGFVVTFDRI